MIEFRHVVKEFKQKKQIVTALNDVSLKVEKGDIFGVIGYSGAGKSTLLRMVNGLEEPTTGQVLVKGKDLKALTASELSQAKKKVSMIFQHFNLLESRTVFENVALPLILTKTSKEDIKKKVTELLDFVGLANKHKSYPHQLSGGQKQRVGIARALVISPEILLCDEATSALDPKTTDSILKLLKRINNEFNITIVMITHEMEVIRALCNKVAVMENAQVIESGDVISVFGNPQQQTTKDFVKTVIFDEIPPSIVRELMETKRNKVIFKLKFIGHNASQPLLNNIAKNFKDIETNIVFANVTELQGMTLGVITTVFYGEDADLIRVRNYIEENDVVVEELKL
ncbi:methionine ABC transporter ATP-binding protein [Solibacillus sp. FSL K6-1523]|uniref:methionine ABC transporter ATP-binding protein n=1 Tax=Solibacillus sp. FSL K6-1523 TaxID=2921471 RepID=UPI0030F60129